MKAVCLSVQAGEHSSLLRFDDFGRSGDGRPYAVGVTGCPGGGGKAVGPNGETRSPKAYVRPYADSVNHKSLLEIGRGWNPAPTQIV